MLDIEKLVETGASLNASDIHLEAGVRPKLRIDGLLQDSEDDVLTADDSLSIARSLAGDQYREMEDIGELDFSKTIARHRCRINLFHTSAGVNCALRILSDHIPALDDLGLPEVVRTFTTYQKGIVLVTGETGSGKSTTLASILNTINHTRREHIITLEDPIEYVYEPDQALISQREIGRDTRSYADGLRAILREDPDVILIGEMRDAETMETAMTAAETGHLVFSTLHTNSAVDSIDRIVGTFPAERQPQIRLQLSTTLKAVLSQQLLVHKSGHGRRAACEVFIINDASKNLIREGKTPQMQSALLASKNLGSQTMDNCLIDMVKRNLISDSTAIEAANDANYVKQNTGMGGFSSSPWDNKRI